MTIAVESELKNLIIGGDFNANPWQRGTSFVSPTTLDYTADRFQYRASGTQRFTIAKDVDNPSIIESGLFDSFCHESTVTTANAAPGAGDFTTIEQPIEGYMSVPIYGNLFGLSFWVKSSVTGIFCVAFQNAARNRNYIVEYTIAVANTWQEVVIQATHDASGTWEIGNLAGLRVIFTLNAGGTFQGAADTWQAGDLVATANQVNLSSSLTNNFKIALVRCIEGIPATVYWMRDAGRTLGLCQRYYQKSYDIGITPGTINNNGLLSGWTAVTSVNLAILTESTKVTMRDAPTIEWYSPVTGASGNIANITTVSDVAISSTSFVGEGHTGYPVSGAAVTSNDEIHAHFTAEAEL